MKHLPVIASLVFVFAHMALVLPYVPLANVLPAGLGAVAISAMALSLILAARWRLVDRLTGGPDKSYVLHRYLGCLAVFGTLGHWVTASDVGTGVLPVLAESGEGVGVIAATGLLALTVAAITRAIPYHLWKASHMLMGPIFVLAAYHTFFVASPLAVGLLPWTVMAVMSTLGIVAWGRTLVRKRSITKLVTVRTATPFQGGIDVTLSSDRPLPPFRPGQFSTLAWNHAAAEAHPFTVAGGDTTSRRFVIRAAGDWTTDFAQTVKPGDTLRLGRPEGRFLPQIRPDRPEQLWVAGGVGITPFLAALSTMTPDDGAKITLVYCIRDRETAGGLHDVIQLAARLPQIELLIFTDAGESRLTAAALRAQLAQMAPSAQAYLCGPDGLKDLVVSVWQAHGMQGRVHSEKFDFRGAYAISDLLYIGHPLNQAVHRVKTYSKELLHATTGS